MQMPAPRKPYVVDNSDWLKTAAIALVAIGHFGYFFIDDADWWSVFGRMAAPVFFFLMGYAQSRTIPFRWIWLGVILTLLDSWNTYWMWVAPNILLSMVLIRLARPHVKILIHRYGWVAFVVLVCALIAVLPLAANVVDYGAEGMAVGPVRLMPAHVCGRQISYRAGQHSPKPRCARASDNTESRLDALTGLLCRRSRVRLAGTKGILVFSGPTRHCHPRCRRHVPWPVSVPARPEPHPATRTHSRHPAFHRLAHPGNLRHSARRIRAHY